MTVTALSQVPDGNGAPAPGDEETPKKSRKKLLVVVLLVLVLAGGGAWFMLKPAGSAAPVPGQVVPLDPIEVNLAGGHYLKIGIALQLVKGPTEADGSKALDAVISEFSGRSMDSLAQAGQRRRLKQQLTRALVKAYDHEVMGVYFTNFVTQ